MNTSPRMLVYLCLSILFWLAVALAIFAYLGGLDVSAAQVEPQATATPEPCTAIGSAEGQTLYLCEDVYPVCVWDPSPTLGGGVVSCDW